MYIKGGAPDTCTFNDVANGDCVVTALQNQRDERLPQELMCSLNPSVLKIRGLGRHGLGRCWKDEPLSPASRLFHLQVLDFCCLWTSCPRTQLVSKEYE